MGAEFYGDDYKVNTEAIFVGILPLDQALDMDLERLGLHLLFLHRLTNTST
jgi:hypothetical protein